MDTKSKTEPRLFETKIDAQEYLKNNKNVFNQRLFCPLFNNQCNTDCVCYAPARVVARKTFDDSTRMYVRDIFMIREGQCENVMFFGRDD